MYRRERERERSAIRRPKGSPFLRAGDANCPKRIEIPPTMVVDAMKRVLGIRFVDRTMEEKIKKKRFCIEIIYDSILGFIAKNNCRNNYIHFLFEIYLTLEGAILKELARFLDLEKERKK